MRHRRRVDEREQHRDEIERVHRQRTIMLGPLCSDKRDQLRRNFPANCLNLTVVPVSSSVMQHDHHNWYSHRLSRDMGVNVYGHYGMPILAFPTSMGDEHEQEGQGMVRTLSPYIEEGRIRFFSINGVQSDSF